MLNLNRLPSLFEISKNFFMYNFFHSWKRKPLLPRAMCLYVTYRCNLRCKICGIWKLQSNENTNELTVKELVNIFFDPLFSKIEFVNINGGEPNLRQDLVEITELIINRFSRLKMITLNSNGIPAEKTIENVYKISNLCKKESIRFSVSLSLHHTGKRLDQISGVKDTYLQVKDAFDGLKSINHNNKFYLSANCVISNFNLWHLEEMLQWSKDEKIPINFTLGEVRERFNNLDMTYNIIINENDKNHLECENGRK